MPTPVGTACVVVAAGLGVRFGADRPKALVELAGEPLVSHAVRRVVASGVIDLVVVTAPPDHVEAVSAAVQDLHPSRVRVVAGGIDRQASVLAALKVVPSTCPVVLVHDAARCLAPSSLVARVVAAVRAGADAVVPGLPVTDTVKQVRDGRVVATVDRSELVAVQTPQGFDRDVLLAAHAASGPAATDDAGLVERRGGAVQVVLGDELAFKVTRPLDLRLAAAVLQEESP